MILPAATPLPTPDSKPFLVRAVLDGRPVATALDPDGTLTISLGGRPGEGRGIGVGTPFRAYVATARQAAQALVRALRAVDAPDPTSGALPRIAPGGPVVPTSVPGLPAGATVSLPVGYVYRTNDRVRPAAHWFASPDGPTVSLVLGLDPGRPLTADVAPVGGQWLVKGLFRSRALSVRGGAQTGLVARFAPPAPAARFGRVPVVATLEETPRAALIAIFAALTYRPAP